MLDPGETGESTWAAEAAECASEQGKFWEYHDKLFIKWLGENVGMYEKSNLKRFAADLKLDQARFNACLDGDKPLPVIQKDVEEGRKLNIPGTPSFFANGKVLQLRSLDFEEFKRLLDPLVPK